MKRLSLVFTLLTMVSMMAMAQSNKTFVLENGKLGPLFIGQRSAAIPKSAPGLYDKRTYKKQTMEDMDGEWTEEYYQFFKGGKKVFRCYINNKKISSFVLEVGSSYIKTPEGFYVGYSGRELFQKKRMEWNTYYEGEVFASSNNFTYYLRSDDIIGNDFPTKLSEIKQSAKISKIVYIVSEE